MRHLMMFWNTERGHLVCHWIEARERGQGESFSALDRLGLSYNPGSPSTTQLLLVNGK
jgi:hypothetical protein